VPPLALMSIPTWMARTVIGDGRAYRVFRFLTSPVIAGVLFNVVVMVLHIPKQIKRTFISCRVLVVLYLSVIFLQTINGL
jgi:putative membrane protein